MRFLIIGGSDAGISAALRAKEIDGDAHVTVLLRDRFPNYSICGIPFFLSGETPDWHDLAHRSHFEGIDIRERHMVTHIDSAGKSVRAEADSGEVNIGYDKLLIATGASPVEPKIDGWQQPGVFLLHSMEDSFVVRDYIASVRPERVIIVGAGYIGLEMADALTHRNMQVVVLGRTHTVLPTVDPEFGEAVAQEMGRHGVAVFTGIDARCIARTSKGLRVTGTQGFDQCCDMVLIAVGVKPNASLGAQAGIQTGVHGALCASDRMESNLPDVLVAGDCGETWHRMLNRFVYLPLGTTAHKQGRVAGENAFGSSRLFPGTLGTQVVKVFSLVMARTGLRHDEALREGFAPQTTESELNDHKAYYPGATCMRIRITGDRSTGRLLGAQIMGSYGAEVSKRIDILATALFHRMTVDAISDVDLSYTPPLSSPWDPVQMASQAWTRALQEREVSLA